MESPDLSKSNNAGNYEERFNTLPQNRESLIMNQKGSEKTVTLLNFDPNMREKKFLTR